MGKFHLNPYYIVTPAYRRASAGIRCLHMLCHHLNLSGEMAYLLQDPDLRDPEAMVTGTDLLTPILTHAIATDHFKRGQQPIVVYPETVKGNPFNAEIAVRYLLNFPGLLGGDEWFPDEEIRFAYSEVLGKAAGCENNILFIPPIDTSVFKPPPEGMVRQGSCFYADKFQKIHGGVLDDCTRGSTEILRGSDKDQTHHEIADLLQRSELFYTYENTALAIEAVLCGCPAVFIPNPYLKGIIASAELGPEGYAWGTDADEIARAKATVRSGADNYLRKAGGFERQLSRFIAKTTEFAAGYRKATQPINMGRDTHVVTVSEHESLFAELILLLFRLFPARFECELAKFFSTVGLKKPGARLWKSALNRSAVKVVVRQSPRELIFDMHEQRFSRSKADDSALTLDTHR